MQYVISFLEGIITFISPCLLPMLPIYISYFAGGGERTTRKTLLGALGFVSGFSVIFVAMGALAGTIGSFLREYQTMVNAAISFFTAEMPTSSAQSKERSNIAFSVFSSSNSSVSSVMQRVRSCSLGI